jgi:methionyl-tRNA synthetase
MIAKNCGGKVPERGQLAEADRAILAMADAALDTARKAMAEQAIHMALAAIFGVVSEANRYFAGQEPWALRKTDPARMQAVLYTTAETIRRVAILCQPFIPGSAAKLLDLLSVPTDRRQFVDLGEGGALAPGTALPAPQGVFPRYVEAESAA